MGKHDDYDSSVFINCPYDDGYLPILHAITFTVRWANFIPRAALEEDDSGTQRLERIYRIVDQCRYCIHDLSRIEFLGPDQLPRFNMPFECGIVFGAVRFGGRHHKVKRQLVLESEPHLTQKTLSDLSGHDPKAHDNRPEEAINRVWSFLVGRNGAVGLPGPEHVRQLYAKFQADLPQLTEALKHNHIEVMRLDQWNVFVALVNAFLEKHARDTGALQAPQAG
jgi:hypothetical protein